MNTSPEQPFDLYDVDFDAFYQGRSPIPGLPPMGVPWDNAAAQQFVIDLEAEGRFAGDVLDVGCGLGDNAIFLASKGYRVTGVDIAPTGIERARERVREHGVDVELAVADATTLADFEDGSFDAVLDSALYHCLDTDQRPPYAATLHRVTRPGARLNLICFTGEGPSSFLGAVGVSEQNIRETLGGAGWSVRELRTGTYEGATLPAHFAAQIAEFLGAEFDGPIRLPVWIALADRA